MAAQPACGPASRDAARRTLAPRCRTATFVPMPSAPIVPASGQSLLKVTTYRSSELTSRKRARVGSAEPAGLRTFTTFCAHRSTSGKTSVASVPASNVTTVKSYATSPRSTFERSPLCSANWAKAAPLLVHRFGTDDRLHRSDRSEFEPCRGRLTEPDAVKTTDGAPAGGNEVGAGGVVVVGSVAGTVLWRRGFDRRRHRWLRRWSRRCQP